MNNKDKIEACLSYLLGWITGLTFFLIRKDSKFVRYHAMQSIVVFGALTVAQILLNILAMIPFIGIAFAVIGWLVWILTIVLWIVLMVKAYQGKKIKMPYAGGLAEKLSGGSRTMGKSSKTSATSILMWVFLGLCLLFFSLSWTSNNTLTTTAAILFYLCLAAVIFILVYNRWKKILSGSSPQSRVAKSTKEQPIQPDLDSLKANYAASRISMKPKKYINLLNDRYEITKIHKTGGMAIINLATDLQTNRQCVVKTPRQGTEHDQINIAKLEFEASYLKNYRHEYILKFIDFFNHNNTPHLVVEYIDGEDLYAKFQFMPAQEKRVVKWAKQILEALEEIHVNGYFHRDIKPGNIMLRENDDIVFIDFGTLKPFDGKGTTIVMSPLFAAPEQIQGRSDVRSDIYGVGGILLYLLTCVAPGKLGETGKHDVKELLISKGISANIATCIAQALQIDPKYRYQSTKAMRRALFPGE